MKVEALTDRVRARCADSEGAAHVVVPAVVEGHDRVQAVTTAIEHERDQDVFVGAQRRAGFGVLGRQHRHTECADTANDQQALEELPAVMASFVEWLMQTSVCVLKLRVSGFAESSRSWGLGLGWARRVLSHATCISGVMPPTITALWRIAQPKSASCVFHHSSSWDRLSAEALGMPKMRMISSAASGALLSSSR